MALELLQLSKTYQGQVVIPEWTQQFEPCETVAIYGGNGSGKSTLLKLLSGQISPTRGHLRCEDIPSETWSLHTSYTGPHVDLIDGYTPKELFAQHAQLRAFRPEAGLEHLPIPPYAFDRPLAQLSSGMKQRIKLALAIWTDAPLLLLDEPCSHLDQVGIEWYSLCWAHPFLRRFGIHIESFLWPLTTRKKKPCIAVEPFSPQGKRSYLCNRINAI